MIEIVSGKQYLVFGGFHGRGSVELTSPPEPHNRWVRRLSPEDSARVLDETKDYCGMSDCYCGGPTGFDVTFEGDAPVVLVV